MVETDDAIVSERGIKPCMACFAANDIDAEICRECGARFGDSDVLQPLNVARAEGRLYQDLALGGRGAKRPKFVILLGVWLMFLPLLAIGVVMVIAQILNLNGMVSFIFICFGAGAAYFSILTLVRVTKRYFRPDDETETAT